MKSIVRILSPRAQRGVSLVELMVALAIGLFLVLGLVQIFSATRTAFAANEGLARTQENSRFAMSFIREDVRMAGHMGCLNETAYRVSGLYNHLIPAAGATSAQWPYRMDYPVQVYEYTGTGPGQSVTLGTRSRPAAGSWSPALPTQLVNKALDKSDVVVVRYLSADFARLSSIGYAAGAESIAVNAADATGFLVDGSIYGITDCEILSLFQVGAGGNVSKTQPLNFPDWHIAENMYGPHNVIHRYNFKAYYVGRISNDSQPGLFRMDLQANSTLDPGQEVVSGVESMQVLVGVNGALRGRTTGDLPDAYLTATQVEAGTGTTWASGSTAQRRWASVVNVRVGLLMQGGEGAGMPAPQPISVADTRITPAADTRVRQAYETLISIRNRNRG